MPQSMIVCSASVVPRQWLGAVHVIAHTRYGAEQREKRPRWTLAPHYVRARLDTMRETLHHATPLWMIEHACP